MAARVFAVAELAHMILLELDIKELLVTAPRVCKQCRNAIEGSTKIQQALFFQPIVTSNNKNVVMNPYLEEQLAHTLRRCHIRTHSPNILIDNRWGRPWRWRLEGSGESQGLTGTPMSAEWWPESYKHPRASWRRMLVCQPAIAVLHIVYMDPHEIGRDGEFKSLFICRVPGGVKLGYGTQDREPAFAVHGLQGSERICPYFRRAELLPMIVRFWKSVDTAKDVFTGIF